MWVKAWGKREFLFKTKKGEVKAKEIPRKTPAKSPYFNNPKDNQSSVIFTSGNVLSGDIPNRNLFVGLTYKTLHGFHGKRDSC